MKNDDDFIHLPELYIKLSALKKHLQKTYKLNINPMKNSDQNVNWSDLNKNLNAGYDDEKMAMISCDIIHEYAVKLDKVIKEDTELEEWVKSKIAKTEQMMASVKHALIGIEKYDHGGELFKQQLLHIGKYAQAIIEVLQDGTELMSWMESNLAVCADHMDNVYHHLDYKMGNRAKDLDKMKDGGGIEEKNYNSEELLDTELNEYASRNGYEVLRNVHHATANKNVPPYKTDYFLEKDGKEMYVGTWDYESNKGSVSLAGNKMKNGGGVSETPIAMMREVTGKSVGTVPVSEKIYSSQVNDFVNYVYEVYAEQGYTKAQVKTAVNKYIKDLGKEFTYGGGDSLDRERVYEYLLNPSLKGIKNPMMRDGGGVSDYGVNYNIVFEKPDSDMAWKETINASSEKEARAEFKKKHPTCKILNIFEAYANGGGVDDINAKREKLIDFYLDNESSYELENFYGVSEDLALNAGTPEGNRIKELRDAVVKYQKLDNNTIVIEKYDIEFNEYANGGGIGKEYKLRAEGLNDFINFLGTGIYFDIKWFKVEITSGPDVIVTFSTNLSLKQIKSNLEQVQDSHVMLDTLKPVNQYTGERMANGGGIGNGTDMIELHLKYNGAPVYINPNLIGHIYRYRVPRIGTDGGYTQLGVTTHNNGGFEVTETSEEIIELIKSSGANKMANGGNVGRDAMFRSQEPHEQRYDRKREYKEYKKEGWLANDWFKNGGGVGNIPNNYENKNPSDVWDMWTPKQREHFLQDHVSGWIKYDTRIAISKMNWKEFHNVDDNTFNSIARQLESHVLSNQYNNGGGVGGERMANGDEVGSRKHIIDALVEQIRYEDKTPPIRHWDSVSLLAYLKNEWEIDTNQKMMANGGGVKLSKADMVFIENMELWVIGSDKVPNEKEMAMKYATSKAQEIDSNFNPEHLLGKSTFYANGGGVGYFKSGYTLKGRKGKYWIDDVEGRVTKDRYFEKEEDAIAEIDLLSRFKKLKNEQRVKGPSMENLMEADRYYAGGGGVENDPLKKKGDIVTDGNNFYEVLGEYTAYNSGADQYARENEGAALPAGLEYGYAYTALKLRNLETGYESSGPYSDYEKIKREDVEGLKQAKLVKDADDKIKEQKRKAEQDAERVIWQAKMEEAERVRNLSKGDIELAKELISDWKDSIIYVDYSFNHHNELTLEVLYTYDKYLGETEPSEEYFITFKVDIEQTSAGYYDPGDRWTPPDGEDAEYKFSLDRVYIEKNGVQVYEGKVEFVELFDKSVLPRIDNWEELNQDVDKEYTERERSY